jgi:hypothetical protein
VATDVCAIEDQPAIRRLPIGTIDGRVVVLEEAS